MNSKTMKTLVSAAGIALLASTATFAQQPAPAPAAGSMMTTLPRDGHTVTNFYKQNVYDPQDNKIGEIEDVLLDKDGRVSAFIIAVGGFLGVGEKGVAAPFNAVRMTKKDNKWYLVMNANKDQLKAAPGYKYDKTATTWVPADRS